MGRCRALRIGLTGPIGSGKSYVADIIRTLGHEVYDADSEAKRLVNTDAQLQGKIKKLLSNRAFDVFGRYDARYVAARIFSSEDLRQSLNSIIHPAVLQDFATWCDVRPDSQLLFMESALLPDLPWREFLDDVVIVTSSAEQRLARVVSRDASTPEAVRARMEAQGDLSRYLTLSNWVIENEGSGDLTYRVHEVLKGILNSR